MSERAAYWRRLLGAWEHSGLSQAEFCRRRGLKAVNLAWWKRRLREAEDTSGGRRGRRAGSTGRTGFVEVALRHGPASVHSEHAAALVPSRDGYAVVLPGGVELRLPDDFDAARVARLVRELVAAC